MNESQFIEASEVLMSAVEDAVDDLDVDTTRSGNVLTIEAENGEEVVINRHTPTGQVWLASRQGGLHFEFSDGVWKSTRDGTDFWRALNEALSFVCEEAVNLTAPKL